MFGKSPFGIANVALATGGKYVYIVDKLPRANEVVKFYRGPSYFVPKVDAKGNCLPISLSHLIHGGPQYYKDVRSDVVGWLDGKFVYYGNEIEKDFDYMNYCIEMSKDFEYFGERELLGASHYYNVRIIVWEPINDEFMNMRMFYDSCDEQRLPASIFNGKVKKEELLTNIPTFEFVRYVIFSFFLFVFLFIMRKDNWASLFALSPNK